MASTEKPAPGSKSETVSAVRDKAGAWVAKALASVTSSGNSFADLVANSDMYEIEAAEIAGKRSRRENVKDFALQMIKDHKKMQEELKSMLGAMNAPKTLPTKVNALFQILIDDLNGASDHDFDKRYIAQQEDVHDVAIRLVRHYGDHGDDSALRELSKLALPVLERHKHMIEHIAGETQSNGL